MIYFSLVGVAAGVFAGLFGAGGGIIILPSLVLFFGLTQIEATATSLIALLAPTGIGAIYAYYDAGKIEKTHFKIGLLISLGMFVGSYFGGKIALMIPEIMLKRVASVLLISAAVRLFVATLKGT